MPASPAANPAGRPAPEPAPFIVGVSRSGTTLLRLMLDSHPDLAIPPETHFAPKLARRAGRGADPTELARTLTTLPRWGDFGLDPDALEQRFTGAGVRDATSALREFYGLYAEREGKPRWGDKTPGYLRQVGLLHELLPEARFIHLIRDGRDVALSLGERSWGAGEVAEAAAKWRDEVGAGRAVGAELPAGTYLELRYEDLVREPETVLRRVAEFIELPWDERMLRHHERAGERFGEFTGTLRKADGTVIVSAEERAAQHARVREPVSTDRLERWRELMPADDRAQFEAVAGGLLSELGYPVG